MERRIIDWEQYKKTALTLNNILTPENEKDIIETIKAEFDELQDAEDIMEACCKACNRKP